MAKYLSTIKGLAVGSSLLSAGGFGVVSLMTIPSYLSALQADHILVANQSATIYGIGLVTQTPSTLLSACLQGYLAFRSYHMPHLTGSWRAWGISSALTAAILPWTFVLMEPQSHGILLIAGVEAEPTPKHGKLLDDYESEKIRTSKMLGQWNYLNAARAVLALLSGSIASYATLP